MFRFGATLRIAFGLACLTTSVLLAVKTAGFAPDHRDAVVEGRIALAESLAVNYSALATQGDAREMKPAIDTLVSRNPDLLSAALRDHSGKLQFESGEHVKHWKAGKTGNSTQVYVPLFRGDKPAGTAELRFKSLGGALFGDPYLQQTVLMGVLTMIAFVFYLRRMLKHLDPSKVVPHRVRAALDTFAEGLLVLDKHSTIVLANKAFAGKIGKHPRELVGASAAGLPWMQEDGGNATMLPWVAAARTGEEQSEIILKLTPEEDEERTFKVNSTPILSEQGKPQGVLASFSDITALEKNKTDLLNVMHTLQSSRDEIRRQNEELQILATRDPLTSCLNRRSFFELFEKHWNDSKRNDRPLTCAMVDVDHFKSINDNYGHSTGDEVLRKVSATLRAGARETDLVCRYGGEEFCILMPGIGADDAWQAAEGHRRAIESLEFDEFQITASLGVSALSFGPPSREDLLDQADKCLYVAKRNGRNQVVRFDQTPDDLVIDEAAISRTPETEQGASAQESIPYHAVQALMSALSYRDPVTAEHSRRVADLCVSMASGLLPARETYILEIAALLHDIGKVGVPDSILLKPGALNDQEWKIMQAHSRIGVEIIRSTFASEELASILEHYQEVRKSGPAASEETPVAARILKIADAYDSMTTDRIYRSGRTQDEAFAELQRCAGTIFDADLVDHFINVCGARDDNRSETKLANKQIALQIGIQIERIATLLDEQDVAGLGIVAARLQVMAAEAGANPVAALAAEIQSMANAGEDLPQLATLVTDLLELYRISKQPEPATPTGTLVL